MKKSYLIILLLLPMCFSLSCNNGAKSQDTDPAKNNTTDTSGDKKAYNTIQAKTLIETNKSWDSALLPSYPTTQPKIIINRYVFPPHSEVKIHKHPVINAGVMLKGELIVADLNGKEITLKAGDAIVEMVNTFHFGKNVSDEPAELIVFYASTEGLPLVILKDK